jgi:hypothetical protein
MAYESPTYRVEERIDEIELRRYEPYLVAETLVQGPLERAGNGGFRLLAGYIFGGNKTADGDSTKIAMTTPVTQDRVGDQYRVHRRVASRTERPACHDQRGGTPASCRNPLSRALDTRRLRAASPQAVRHCQARRSHRHRRADLGSLRPALDAMESPAPFSDDEIDGVARPICTGSFARSGLVLLPVGVG